jgi:hypothetical protein
MVQVPSHQPAERFRGQNSFTAPGLSTGSLEPGATNLPGTDVFLLTKAHWRHVSLHWLVGPYFVRQDFASLKQPDVTQGLQDEGWEGHEIVCALQSPWER